MKGVAASKRRRGAWGAWGAGAVVLGVGVLAGSGCSSTKSQLTAQFGKAHKCAEHLTTVSQSGSRYRVSGCGQSEEYECETFANSRPDAPCKRVDLPSTTSPGDGAPTPTRRIQDMPPGARQ